MNSSKKILALLSLLIIFSTSSLVAQNECRKAVFVYLDVSGSMYSDHPSFDNNTTYRSKSMKLIDALVYLLEDLLSPSLSSPVLREGDKFELMGFYEEVNHLLPPILSYQHFDETKDIFKQLDKTHDGKLDNSDFDNKFHNQSRTDFINVVNSFGRRLGEINLSNKIYEQILFIVFSDGNHDGKISDLTAYINNFNTEYYQTLKEKKISIFFFELQPSNVSQIFKEKLPTYVYPLSTIDSFNYIINAMQQSLGDYIKIVDVSPTEITVDLDKKKQIDLQLKVVNFSCYPAILSKIEYTIFGKRTEKQIGKLEVNKELLYADTLIVKGSIPFDFSIADTFKVSFIPITKSRNKPVTDTTSIKLITYQSSFNIGAILFGLILLIVIVASFILMNQTKK